MPTPVLETPVGILVAEARASWTIVHPEKCPADPLKDEATRFMTHRGGVVSARVELY